MSNRRTISFQDSFWSRVNKDSECWEWKGSLLRGGYGIFCFKRRRRLSHRVSYELAFGEIPKGLLVCHKCDNRKCVRPDHLFLGTHADNAHDMHMKGRQAKPEQTKHVGEDNGSAKLTSAQAREIRFRYQNEKTSHRKLGKEYGVSQTVIRHIVIGLAWKTKESGYEGE